LQKKSRLKHISENYFYPVINRATFWISKRKYFSKAKISSRKL